jgi:hypothetical protein
MAHLDGDPSRFVVAGRQFVDPAKAPPELHVFAGSGYDGQFFYRLALDPADLETEAHGIRLDTPYRRARIAYPALGWAASGGGQPEALSWALIALNVAGVGLLGLLGGLVARDAGRHALWGLLVPAFPGFAFAVSRDLAEVIAAAGLVGALLLARRGHWLGAGVVLSLAVLTRESAAVAVAALALVWLVRRRPAEAAAWLLPVAALGAWELVVWARYGSVPLLGDRNAASPPFAGLLPSALDWFREATTKGVLLRLADFALVIGGTAVAAASLRRSRAQPAEKLAWAFALALALCLSAAVYEDPGDFRVVAELWVLSALVVLADPRRRFVPLFLAALPLCGAVAFYRVFVV